MSNSVKRFRYVQKTPLTLSEGLVSNVCKFLVIAVDVDMNHRAGSLTNCK